MVKNLEAKFSNIILHQEASEINRKGIYRPFNTLTGECIDNNIYLFGLNNNSICTINKTTGNISVQLGDESMPYSKEGLYIKSIAYKKNVFFISDKINRILKLDTVTNKKTVISFRDVAMDYEPVLYKTKLFLLPIGYSDQLVCCNLENGDISYLSTNYRSELNQAVWGEAYIFGKTVAVGGCCYRGSYLGADIQKFHMESGRFEYMKINGFDQPIRNIVFDGEFFWILSSRNGQIIRWDQNRNEVLLSIDLAKETGKPSMIYTSCAYCGETLYIPEKQGSCILELRLKENMLVSYDYAQIPEFKSKRQNGQAFSEFIKIDPFGEVCFFPYQSNGVAIKSKDGILHFYPTETAKILEFSNEQQQNESICTLEHFCSIVSQKSRNQITKKNFGTRIIEEVRKLT